MQGSGSINEVWLVWVSATTRLTWRVCLVLSLLPLLPGPISCEHKRTRGRQLPGDPKGQKMGEGKCQSQEGAEDGRGEGAQGQCSVAEAWS